MIETIVSLVVFSAIVLPLALVPPKAAELSKENEGSSILAVEGDRLFEALRQDINLSYRFLPFWEMATHEGLDMPQHRMVFTAYTDTLHQREVHVGYQLQEMFRDAPTNKVSYSPKRWRLLRQYFGNDTDIRQLQANDAHWQAIATVRNDPNFYLTGSKSDEVMFAYCQGFRCAPDVNPGEADGVRLQAGADGKAFRLVYAQTDMSLSPIYSKLASRQSSGDRHLAENQILPVSLATNRWDHLQSWTGEVRKQNSRIGPYRVPIASSKEARGNAMALPLNDFHYNGHTGELIGVSSSPTSVPESERSLYLFKFRPGLPDYRPYSLRMAGPGKGKGMENSYTDNFPLVIAKGDAAWPPGASPEYRGITQDTDNNLYVLAKSSGYWILKFSPDGTYRSRFNLSRDLGIHSLGQNAMALTYSPAMPNDLLVFAETRTGQFTLRAYPKNQNEDDPERVVMSASSKPLRDSDLAASLGTSWQDFHWQNVTGMEYDPLHHRILFVEKSPLNQARVISLAMGAGLSGPAGPGSIVGTSKLYAPGSASLLTFPIGIAYDPRNNVVFLATSEGNRYPYYRIMPSVALNTTQTLRSLVSNR